MLSNKIIGGDKMVYTTSKWYKYEANRLIYNIKNIDKYILDREYISAEDIVDYISYCKYGCFLLLSDLREFKKKLRVIENKIRTGAWVNKQSASISKLTSDNINIFIDNITNISKLKELSELIFEDIYMSYFYSVNPNIYLPDPKPPVLPPLSRETINIKNSKELVSMIKDTIPYLEILEKYHMDLYKLINLTNAGLEKIIRR